MDGIWELERGRNAFARRAWGSAFEALTTAVGLEGDEPETLEMLATAAYMVGHEDEYLATLERAHRARLEAGNGLGAARAAFWIGISHARRGNMGPAGGWLGRARRLIEDHGKNCVERGYLLLPLAFELEADGELEAASEALTQAAAIGEEFSDRDLFALAAHEQGHLLIKQGRAAEGVRLLDESMVAVAAGELSPIVSGLVYCGVILACQDAHQTQRAQQWTTALADWCDEQPEMLAFSGVCRVHKAELLQLSGAWPETLKEAERARERCLRASNEAAAAAARYVEAEVYRLRGELEAAEAAYRGAAHGGVEPQPGLALLRLAQGEVAAAGASIERALGETTVLPKRALLLAAAVEVALARAEPEAAERAWIELEQLAEAFDSPLLDARSLRCRGMLELASGEAVAALVTLRRSWRLWRELSARYEEAVTRGLIARACAAAGDRDAAEAEAEAARATLVELGAAPALEQLGTPSGPAGERDRHGLTARELEVLSHMAAGRTNRAIADELVLSKRTIDRHASNIYAKLGVSSRAAATAFALRHELLPTNADG